MFIGLTPTQWGIPALEVCAAAFVALLLVCLTSRPSEPESEQDWLDRQY